MKHEDDLLSICWKKREEGQCLSAAELCRDCHDRLSELQSQIRAILALEPAELYFRRTVSKKDSHTKPDSPRGNGDP